MKSVPLPRGRNVGKGTLAPRESKKDFSETLREAVRVGWGGGGEGGVREGEESGRQG